MVTSEILYVVIEAGVHGGIADPFSLLRILYGLSLFRETIINRCDFEAIS